MVQIKPKQGSTVKFQIFKFNSAYCAHCAPIRANPAVLKTHKTCNNFHNQDGRQLQFTPEVTLIGAHIVSKLQTNPTIIAKVIDNFVHSNFFQDHFLSIPLCCKLYQNQAIWQFLSRPSIWSPFRSYFYFFQDHCPNFTPFKTIFGTSFKTITLSLILAQC